MREIKFRAFNTELKKMVYPDKRGWFDRVIRSKKNGVLNTVTIQLLMLGDYPEVELQQYTGLDDKNGVEIYEGDVVRIVVPDQHSVTKGNGFEEVSFDKGFTSEGAVQFLHSMWFIDQGEGKGLPLDFDDTQIIKVLGNVFQNPELLPNKK